MSLDLDGVTVRFGASIALDRMSLSIAPGEVHAVFGGNGAGKSTLARVVTGLVAAESGRIVLDGRDLTLAKPWARTRAGIALVPQNQEIFPELSVLDHFRLARSTLPRRERARDPLEGIFEHFPELVARSGDRTGLLSGGQRQMVAIGRALALRPRYLICDEPSVGLVHKTVESMLRRLQTLANEGGIGVLLIEQNVPAALRVADRVSVLRRGRLEYEGPPSADPVEKALFADTVAVAPVQEAAP